MKSSVLLPYCPLPVDTGAKTIMVKHLQHLRSMGECEVVSARTRPVGAGWSERFEAELQNQGFDLSFRKKNFFSSKRLLGLLYGSICKGLRLEKAFGHSNSYHKSAFDAEWWFEKTRSSDIAEIHYSYWAHFPCDCPKVVVVHDLWSDIMWGGSKKETTDLKTADLVVTVSFDEKRTLQKRGLTNVHWSPPCVNEEVFCDSQKVAVLGSGNRHNVEGINWLRNGLKSKLSQKINCYGAISQYVASDDNFVVNGFYEHTLTPFEECGIVLMLTTEGSGTQIKGIESLACGRAIIARKGAMRGLPTDCKGWVEVESVDEMQDKIQDFQNDDASRKKMMEKARAYYQRYLDKDTVLRNLKREYQRLCA